MTSIKRLEQELSNARAGLDTVQAMNRLAWELRQIDIGRALALAESAESLCAHDARVAAAMELVRSLRTQAFVETVRGNYRRALALSNRALQEPIAQEMPQSRVDLLSSLGWCVGIFGDHARAIKVLHESLDLAIEIGNEIRQARVLTSLGGIYSLAQDNARSVESLEQALGMDATQQDAQARTITLNNLAVAYSELGRHDEAYATGLASLDLAMSGEGGSNLDAIYDTLGEICLKRGDLSQALDFLGQAIVAAERSGGKADLCTALLHQSQVMLELGRLDEALSSAIRGIDLAHTIAASYEQCELHEILSRVYEAEGNDDEALRHFRLFHEAKEELFGKEAAEKLRNLQTAYELEAARKDAEIHQLRNVELEQEIAERKRAEEQLQQAIAQLQTALDEVQTLSGLVPICASCKKIRSDEGYWEHVEEYISSHTNAQFSHGICPDCAKALYGELGEDLVRDQEQEDTDSQASDVA